MPNLSLGIDARQAAKGAQEFVQATDQVSRAADASAKQLNQQQKGMDLVALTAQRAASALVIFFSAIGAGAALLEGTRRLMEFEVVMKSFEAVTKASTDEMADFVEVARRMGASSSFSANQVGEAMLVLAKAGFTTAQSVEAVAGVVNLATVESIGLNEAAETVVSTLSQFHLEANQAIEVVDQLAVASNLSQASVMSLAEGMKYAGAFAGSMGISVAETSAALSVLSKAGIQGSMAGTNLRGILIALLAPTEKAKAVLKELELSAADVNPEIVGLTEAMRRLGESGMNATQAETLFDRLNVTAGSILASQSELIAEFQDEISQANGASAELARTMNDTLVGASKRFMSALDELLMQIGSDGLLGTAKDAVYFATDVMLLLGGIEARFEGNAVAAELVARSIQGLTAGFATFLALSAAARIYATVQALGGLQAAIKALMASMSAASMANPILLTATAVGVLVTAMNDIDPVASKAREAMNRYKAAVEGVKGANEAAADSIDAFRAARERDDVEDQIASINRLLSETKRTDDLLQTQRGQSQLGPLVDVQKYRNLFDLNDQTRESFRKLFYEYREEGGQRVLNTNQAIFDSGSEYQVWASQVQDALRGNITVLKDQREELTKTLNAQRGIKERVIPPIQGPGLVSNPDPKALRDYEEMLTLLQEEASIVNALSGDQTALARAREFSRFSTEALQVTEKLYGKDIVSQAAALAQLVDAYDAVTKAKEESRMEAERLKAVEESNKNLQTMRDQIQLMKEYGDSVEELRKRREEYTVRIEAQSLAEKMYGDDINRQAEYLREYMATWEQMYSMQAQIEEQNRKVRRPKEKIEIDYVARDQEQAKKSFDELMQRTRDERDTIFMLNEQRDIELKYREAERIANEANISDKETQLRLYREELRLLQRSRELQNIAYGVGDAFGQMFRNMVFGAENARQAIGNLAMTISEMVFQQSVARPIASWITGGLSSVFSGMFTGAGAMTTGSAGFGQTQIPDFGYQLPTRNTASGGIFSQYGYEPMGNLLSIPSAGYNGGSTALGERGTIEGVFPLTQGPRGLGIVAYGGEASRIVNVYLNIYTKDYDGFRRNSRQLRSMLHDAVSQGA